MTTTNPKFEVAAEIQKLGDPNLPEGVIDGRPKGILLGPEVPETEDATKVWKRKRTVPTGFKANAHPPQEGGLEIHQIPAGDNNDRRVQELFEFGQRELQRQVINDRVIEKLAKSLTPAEVDTKDIAYTLACYGGRLEVKNFGSFYIKEIPGHYRNSPRNKNSSQWFVPGRRGVIFYPSEALLALLNDNYYGTQIDPTPNSDFFIERRNMIIE